MGKQIVVLITRAPHGSIRFTEGLRAAMGLVACTDELEVTALLIGEGVYGALAALERGEVARYIATMAQWGCSLKAEKESLEERGIGATELAPDVEVISRQHVSSLLQASDFTVGF